MVRHASLELRRGPSGQSIEKSAAAGPPKADHADADSPLFWRCQVRASRYQAGALRTCDTVVAFLSGEELVDLLFPGVGLVTGFLLAA